MFVTGATGLVGAYLLPLLNESSVSALYRDAHEDVRANWIQHDLKTKIAQIPEGTETIVHLAQSPGFREFPEASADIFSVNVGSTADLLDVAYRQGVKRFVLASSGAVYRSADIPLIEDALLTDPPSSFYAASKLSAEILCAAYKDLIHITILRFFFVYGPKQRREMLLPRLVDRVRAGAAIQLQGNDGMRFNPIHAADAAEAVHASLKLEGYNVINVAGPSIISMRWTAMRIGELLGVTPVFETEDGTAVDLVANIEAMERKLGKPRVTPNEGIAELVRA